MTEEEGKEGNEQRLDRKQSSSQNLMHLRKDPVQNVTRTTLEESRELQSTPGCFVNIL